MKYLDLDIEIGRPANRLFPVSIESAEIGKVRGSMRRPRVDTELLKLRVALLQSGSAQPVLRGVPSEVEEPARDLGRKLFTALFTGDAKAAYDAAVSQSLTADGLRLRLGIDDPSLLTMPWEFLFDPAQEEYLCLTRGVALIRYLSVLRPPPALRVTLPLRVLALVVSPDDEQLQKLNVAAEQQRIEEALAAPIQQGLVTLTWARGQTVDDLSAALRSEPNIFHFVGHGDFDRRLGEGGIYLADTDGRAARLDATRLGQVFNRRKGLQLVVLNACEGARGDGRAIFSSTAATLVRRGIPAVVAMQYMISDQGAARFAHQFYAHVAAGDPVDTAVTEARIAMNVGATTVEWGSPVLYMQSPDGVLFDLSRPVVAAGVSSEEEPPARHTWVVDPFHRADFTSIGAAIAAASPGDVIRVHSGYYGEALVIDRPLEIIGDSRNDVVIAAEGRSAITFRTTNARVASVSIRQGSGEPADAVDIVGGRLVLEDCDITSSSQACIMIRGEADPRIVRNRIHDSRQSGVFIVENARGVLEDNEIAANARNGVAISSGAAPVLRQNRILQSGERGVYVYDGGQGLMESNDIARSQWSGIEVRSGSAPTVRDNLIHDGGSGGILVARSALGVYESNHVRDNAGDGVEVRTDASPTLRGNELGPHNSRGIYYHDGGRGQLEDNDVVGNTGLGIEIRTGANPTVRGNRVRDNSTAGVVVARNGRGLLEGNEISGNALNGVEIRSGANPVLRHNRINANGQHAVWVHDGGAGTLEDNDLSANPLGALDIAPDSQAGTRLTNNRQ